MQGDSKALQLYQGPGMLNQKEHKALERERGKIHDRKKYDYLR